MKVQKRGQAAFEYMLIALVIGVMILPAAYLFFRYSSGTAEQLDQAQLDRLGRDVVAAAEKIYYEGSPSRTEIEARMPKGVLNVSIIGDWNSGAQLLLIRARSMDTITDFPYPSKININGSFNGSLAEVTTGAGIKKITVEAYDVPGPGGKITSFAHINFGGRCPASTYHDYASGGGYTAEDHSFIMGCCANLPGRPKYRPSVTWQSGWFNMVPPITDSFMVCMNADLDGDCDVDAADYLAWCAFTGYAGCAPTCP